MRYGSLTLPSVVRRSQLRFMAALLLMLAVVCSSVAAHDLPMNSIMNAFVKVEPRQIDLVVRVPQDLLRGVPFPAKGSQYDVAASGSAAELALVLLEDTPTQSLAPLDRVRCCLDTFQMGGPQVASAVNALESCDQSTVDCA